jgi:hypothetical protein
MFECLYFYLLQNVEEVSDFLSIYSSYKILFPPPKKMKVQTEPSLVNGQGKSFIP